MTVELRKGQQSINILNVCHIRNIDNKMVVTPMPTANEADAKPLHVYIDAVHVFSTFELTLDREDLSNMRVYID